MEAGDQVYLLSKFCSVRFKRLFYGPNPYYETYNCLTAIQEMLINPNPHSPANSTAGQEYMTSRAVYSKKVKAAAKKHMADS